MKTKKFAKKLSLRKATIASLDSHNLLNVMAGEEALDIQLPTPKVCDTYCGPRCIPSIVQLPLPYSESNCIECWPPES